MKNMIIKNKLPIAVVIAVILIVSFIVYRQKPTATPTEPPKSIEAELLPFINPKNDPKIGFEILKTENNFYYVVVNNTLTAGAAIWKKEGDKFRQVASGDSASFDCDDVISENIPPALVNDHCYDEQKDTTMTYNGRTKEWISDSTYIDLSNQELQTIKTELYLYINPKNDPNITFDVSKGINNFVFVSIGSKEGAGVATIWKQEGEKWRKLLATQDAWECEIVLSEFIPPKLVNNECFFYKTQKTWKYNTELNEWKNL